MNRRSMKETGLDEWGVYRATNAKMNKQISKCRRLNTKIRIARVVSQNVHPPSLRVPVVVCLLCRSSQSEGPGGLPAV